MAGMNLHQDYGSQALHSKCLYGLPPVAGNAARHFERRVVPPAGFEPATPGLFILMFSINCGGGTSDSQTDPGPEPVVVTAPCYDLLGEYEGAGSSGNVPPRNET